MDTHDKEAWPSIGDQSETASDTGADTDNASVKSGSVISSSSNPGSAQQVDSVLQSSSSAIHGQGASSVWGANFASNLSDEKIDSSAWGSNPVSQISSRGWGDSVSQPVSAVNNQGPNMQSGQSSVSGSDNLNPLNNRTPGMNWGLSTTAVGSNGQQNTMQGQEHGINSSGAQTNNLPSLSDSQSGSTNAMSWQGINFSSSGLPGLQKDKAANPGSAWGNVSSVGNSVIGSGLGISTSTAGSYSMDNKTMDQWGSSDTHSSSSSLGWGGQSSASQPEPSGWGSPSPSPIPGAGTEAWGAPDPGKGAPQAWGQPNTKANSSAPSGWGQSDAKISAPSPSNWGDIPPPPDDTPATGWGAPPKPSPSPWGQPPQSNTQSQWGAPAANPPSNPQPQSHWGSAGAASGSGTPGTPDGPSAWGSSGPVGSKPPPNPQSQPPTSWAQAAGRGLYAQQQKPPTPAAPPTPDPKEQYIASVVNSSDGWGKCPIRQDTSWEVEESPKATRRNSNTEIENPSSHWDNNKGTAIWEASKGSAAPPPPQWSQPNPGNTRGASGGWDSGRDNDSGHWNGPPGDNSSHWGGHHQSSGGSSWGGQGMGGPPQPPAPSSHNQWGHHRDGSGDRSSGRDNHWGNGGSSSSNSWDGNNSDSSWGGGKEDNVWDRNGTNAWGSNSKVETGMWGGGERRGSSSSWGDEKIEPTGWEDPNRPSHQRQGSGGSVDDGTAYWGDPTAHKANNWASQPSTPSTPGPHMPQDDKNIGMWGGPPSNKPPSSWGDRPDDGPSYWGGNQPVSVKLRIAW